MQLFTNLFILLSAVSFVVAIPEKYPAAALVVRQNNPIAPAADPCKDYSMTANMSVISANSSYRTAFLQKSNVGTIINARMLNAAQLKLPKLTADVALNSQCGNLTTVAITEAAKNYTMGIVAQFTTAGLPVGIRAGPEVGLIVIIICTLFSIVWIFAA